MLSLYKNVGKCFSRNRRHVLNICINSTCFDVSSFQTRHVVDKKNIILPITRISNLEIHRNKHTKNDNEVADDDSDSDEDVLQKWKAKDRTLNKISTVVRTRVNSLRLDHVVKAGLGISRSKSEVMFYQGKIRVNGKKPQKKSIDVNVGDEVDVIRAYNQLNPQNLNVSRLEVLDLIPKDDTLLLIMRKYKTLTVENYSDPFSGSFDD